MGKQILTFVKSEIEKNKFHRYRTPIFLRDVDIKEALVTNKISFGGKNYKYFIGYLYDNHKVEPLHIMLPKSTTCVKSFDFD